MAEIVHTVSKAEAADYMRACELVIDISEAPAGMYGRFEWRRRVACVLLRMAARILRCGFKVN